MSEITGKIIYGRKKVEIVVKDRVYTCLNPVGIQDPVDQFPLEPRLDIIDGKTIYLSIGGGEEVSQFFAGGSAVFANSDPAYSIDAWR